MLPLDLDPALSFCSHLVYGYAGVQPDTYKMVPLNENLDVDRSHANYRAITNFKTKYPGLKVLLSVGGDVDLEEQEKYNLLVSPSTYFRYFCPESPLSFSAAILLDSHLLFYHFVRK